MLPGQHVQIIEQVKGMKKIHAEPLDLVTIISVNHLPVLLVHHFEDTEKSFPVRVEKVTNELHPKNIAKLKKK